MRKDIVKWLLIKEGYYKEIDKFNIEKISKDMLPSSEKILEKMFNTVLDNYDKNYYEKGREEAENICLERLNSFLDKKNEVIKWIVKNLDMEIQNALLGTPEVGSINFASCVSRYDDDVGEEIDEIFKKAGIDLNKEEQIESSYLINNTGYNNENKLPFVVFFKDRGSELKISEILEKKKQRKRKRRLIVLVIIITVFAAIIFLILGLSLKTEYNPPLTLDNNNNNENTKNRKNNPVFPNNSRIKDSSTSIILEVLPYAGVALGGTVPAICLAVQNSSGSKNNVLQEDNKYRVETIKDEADGNTPVEGLGGINRNKAKSKTNTNI